MINCYEIKCIWWRTNWANTYNYCIWEKMVGYIFYLFFISRDTFLGRPVYIERSKTNPNKTVHDRITERLSCLEIGEFLNNYTSIHNRDWTKCRLHLIVCDFIQNRLHQKEIMATKFVSDQNCMELIAQTYLTWIIQHMFFLTLLAYDIEKGYASVCRFMHRFE